MQSREIVPQKPVYLSGCRCGCTAIASHYLPLNQLARKQARVLKGAVDGLGMIEPGIGMCFDGGACLAALLDQVLLELCGRIHIGSAYAQKDGAASFRVGNLPWLNGWA